MSLFQIKHRFTGAVLFEKDCDSLKICAEAAVKVRANLGGAYLGGANLGGANLGGANLGDADLGGANLGGANLGRANLSRAYLGRANLGDANLGDANLGGAYLSDAYLGDAYLGGANLGGAKGIRPERTTDLLMLLDQPGTIRAYKLVNEHAEGPFNGGIKYEIDGTYEVIDANTNADQQCGPGINVATLPWCLQNWSPGYRVLIVEFTAADIACIPTATDGKFRLHRCKVVGEKIIDPVALGLVKPEKAAAA